MKHRKPSELTHYTHSKTPLGNSPIAERATCLNQIVSIRIQKAKRKGRTSWYGNLQLKQKSAAEGTHRRNRYVPPLIESHTCVFELFSIEFMKAIVAF